MNLVITLAVKHIRLFFCKMLFRATFNIVIVGVLVALGFVDLCSVASCMNGVPPYLQLQDIQNDLIALRSAAINQNGRAHQGPEGGPTPSEPYYEF